jgi:5-methylcytosine-specific restriction endonuclease McrA
MGVLTPGEIVHHKTHITPDNINNKNVTLSFANLELLCRKCHAEEHPEIYGKTARPQRVVFDEQGNVMKKEVDLWQDQKH